MCVCVMCCKVCLRQPNPSVPSIAAYNSEKFASPRCVSAFCRRLRWIEVIVHRVVSHRSDRVACGQLAVAMRLYGVLLVMCIIVVVALGVVGVVVVVVVAAAAAVDDAVDVFLVL